MTKGERGGRAAMSPAALEHADDRTLVDAFAAGQREAFDVIVARHQRQVFRICYRFAGHHQDAADLAQDVFLRAFRHLPRFKQESALSTWLHRIAVNTCLNRAAEKKRLASPLDGIDIPDVQALDPLHLVIRDQAAGAVRAAIRQLPPKQRATVILRVYEGLSHDEIARALGGTVGAAKANLFHALGNLRRLVKR